MFILPYQVEAGRKQLPVMTLAIGLACLVIYYFQYVGNARIDAALQEFCRQEIRLHPNLFGGKNSEQKQSTCRSVFRRIYYSENKQEAYQLILKNLNIRQPDPLTVRRFLDYLQLKYSQFAKLAPDKDLSSRLWLPAGSFDPQRMLTAAFAHGSWWHVIGNVFFFIVFASAVERVIGWKWFLALFLVIVYSSHAVYSLVSLFRNRQEVTVGLSGAVIGMMAFMAIILPRARVRCVFWAIIFLTTVSLPAWTIAFSYIGLDLLRYAFSDNQSNINFVVHIAGAGSGLLIAMLIPRDIRRQMALRSSLHYIRRYYRPLSSGSDDNTHV